MLSYLSIFEDLFNILQVQQNNIIVMAIFVAIHILNIALRIAVFIGLRGYDLWLATNLSSSKSLKTLSEVKSIRSGLLRTIVNEYVYAAEKNAPRVPLDHIVNKHVSALNLIGWRYTGIIKLVNKLDNGLVLIGIALALVFVDYAVVYGLIAVAGFIILKIIASIFDCESAKDVLKADIHLYVEREVGQFFAGHVALVINRFKEDVSDAIDRQSSVLRSAVEKLGTDFIPVMENLYCLKDLPAAVEDIQQSNERYALQYDTMIAQSQMIKDSQKALEASVTSYEISLQNFVQSMGDGLGTFIQMHGQAASKGIVTVLEGHVKSMESGNKDTMNAITALLEQLTNQNKDISTHLRLLHERINEL